MYTNLRLCAGGGKQTTSKNIKIKIETIHIEIKPGLQSEKIEKILLSMRGIDTPKQGEWSQGCWQQEGDEKCWKKMWAFVETNKNVIPSSRHEKCLHWRIKKSKKLLLPFNSISQWFVTKSRDVATEKGWKQMEAFDRRFQNRQQWINSTQQWVIIEK